MLRHQPGAPAPPRCEATGWHWILGEATGWHWILGHWILGIKEKIRELLEPGNMTPWQGVVNRLDRKLGGWSNYFRLGARLTAYRAVHAYVFEQAQRFLRRRHKLSTQGNRRFSADVIFGRLGVLELRKLYSGYPSCAGT